MVLESGYAVDARRLQTQVLIIENGLFVPLRPSGIIVCDWDYGIDKVPTARIRIRNPVPVNVHYFADVRILAGFGDSRPTTVFSGKVLNILPDDLGSTIECAGYSWPLDVSYHEAVITIDNDLEDAVAAFLLNLAGVTAFVIDLPVFTLATVQPVTLTFKTYAEAIGKVLEIEGAHWYEDPQGVVHIGQLDQIASSIPRRTYFSGVLTGLTESFPLDIAIGRPRLRNMSRLESVRDVKNQIVVLGATINTVQADGTTLSSDIGAVASAPSIYVLNPDGSTAFNVYRLTNELIQTAAKATEVAQRYLFLFNRLQQTSLPRIDGDPELSLAQTVRVVDEQYSGVSGLFFVQALNARMGDGQFGMDVTLFGGGAALNVKPIASFEAVVEREVMTDREWIVVGLDASGSVDPDGEIFTYAWSDNQAPQIATGSAKAFTVRADPATLVQPWIITLTVTDFGGAVATAERTVVVDPSEPQVVIPAMSVAFDTRFSASPDGAQSWNDQVGTSVLSTAMSPAGFVNENGEQLTRIVYGTTAGGVYYTDDFCLTAPVQVMPDVGSPIRHLHWDTNDTQIVWAVTRDGRVYQSAFGVTWSIYENLRTKLALPNLLANKVQSPLYGGVRVLGGTGAGTGRPWIGEDRLLNHTWTEVGIGGDLLNDLNSFQPSDLEIFTGTYVGTGAALNVPHGLTAVPDVVITYRTGRSACIRAKNWGSNSFLMEGGSALANGITNATASVFTLGNNANVNTLGETYNFVAIRHKTAGIASGSFVCSGLFTQVEASLKPPQVVGLFGGTRGIIKTSTMQANECAEIGAAAAFPSDEMFVLLPNGFTLQPQSASGDANTVGETRFWVTFPWDKAMRIDTYVGNAVDNRNLFNFAGKYGIVMGDTAQQKVHRSDTLVGDLTHELSAGGATAADKIQQLSSTFQVGLNAQVNSNLVAYHLVAFGDSGGATPAADLIVADAAYRRPNELMIVLNSATFPTLSGGQSSVYYLPDVFDSSGPWRRTYGAHRTQSPQLTLGVAVCADQELDKFIVLYGTDRHAYLFDGQNGLYTSVQCAAAGQIDATDTYNSGLWMGARIPGLVGAYLLAAEGAADGTVYKTIDRFTTITKVRPATGFPASPAGANAKQVAIGTGIKAERLLVQQSPVSSSGTPNFAARVARLNGATWGLQSNPAAAAQTGYKNMRRLGANLYRIQLARNLGLPQGNAGGQLQRSIDDGITWGNVGPAPVTVGGIDWGINDVDIGADGVLWACACINGNSGNVGFPAPTVYKSIDAGATWSSVYTDTNLDGGNWRRFIAICPSPNDPLVIATVGDRSPGICNTWLTLDGGATPFLRNTGTALQDTTGDRRAVMMDNGRIVQLATANGDILYTDDFGGTNWTPTAYSFATRQWQIVRVGQVLFAAGASTTVPVLKRSTDYGVTWQDVVTAAGLTDGRFQVVFSPSSGKLYIAMNSTGTTLRVFQWDNPFETVAVVKQVSTLKDLTNNLDALFTDADAADQTIGLQGITL